MLYIFNTYLYLENSIVLTYVGGDEDRDPRDTCKGQRWTTYLAFVCDPFSTSVSYNLLF